MMVVAILTALALVTGCATIWMGKQTRKGASSSLVDYLYPNGEIPPEFGAAIPNLNLPLRVGLAFVPALSDTVEGLSEVHQTMLLEEGQSIVCRQGIHQIHPDHPGHLYAIDTRVRNR